MPAGQLLQLLTEKETAFSTVKVNAQPSEPTVVQRTLECTLTAIYLSSRKNPLGADALVRGSVIPARDA